jgi:putative oxidoreductase
VQVRVILVCIPIFKSGDFLGSLLGCLGGVLMIFGLFFRIGVLLVLVLAIGHAIAVYKGTGFRVALPSIEMCFVLAGLLFIGPGKYSIR